MLDLFQEFLRQHHRNNLKQVTHRNPGTILQTYQNEETSNESSHAPLRSSASCFPEQAQSPEPYELALFLKKESLRNQEEPQDRETHLARKSLRP